MAGRLGLSEGLRTAVRRKFIAAEASNSLTFSSTELAIITAAGTPVSEYFYPTAIRLGFTKSLRKGFRC